MLLPSTPLGDRPARLLATEQLRTWEIALDPARPVVAEPATNAATHGRVPGRDFGLTLGRRGRNWTSSPSALADHSDG